MPAIGINLAVSTCSDLRLFLFPPVLLLLINGTTVYLVAHARTSTTFVVEMLWLRVRAAPQNGAAGAVILSPDDAGDRFSLILAACWSIFSCHAGTQSLQ